MKLTVIKFSEPALSVFDYISKRAINSKSDMTLLKSILRNIELIKQNPFYGNPIAKKLIPKEYILKYDAQNVYRIELPYFYRMLYVLKDEEIEILAFILDIIDHREYNKKFKYK